MSIFLIGCKSKDFILKTYYYEGNNNELKRFYEYNTKDKLYISKVNDSITEKRINLKNREKNAILNKLHDNGVLENFCWLSVDTPSEYHFKYEIILNPQKPMSKCIDSPIQYGLFETYHTVKELIRKHTK